MTQKNKKFNLDLQRFCELKVSYFKKLRLILFNPLIKAFYFGRLAERKKGILHRFCVFRSKRIFLKYGTEIISFKNIGSGLLLVHPYNITINSRSQIGENLTIFKGATIGSIRSGPRKGTPKIGNRVTICANAFVCGNVSIGDDVLIAANSFVNFDVPPNSIVIGNPGVIHKKNNPSCDYLLKEEV